MKINNIPRASVICKGVPDKEKCELRAYELSSTSELIKTKRNGERVYDRLTRWHCYKGHINTTQRTYSVANIKIETESQDDSPKRFHRKGFTNHNPRGTSKPLWEDTHQIIDPKLTNHSRMLMRKSAREAAYAKN